MSLVQAAQRDARDIIVVVIVGLAQEPERALRILKSADCHQPVGDRIPVSDPLPSVLDDVIEIRKVEGVMDCTIGELVSITPTAGAGILGFVEKRQ